MILCSNSKVSTDGSTEGSTTESATDTDLEGIETIEQLELAQMGYTWTG
jgi:hypothetical protein